MLRNVQVFSHVSDRQGVHIAKIYHPQPTLKLWKFTRRQQMKPWLLTSTDVLEIQLFFKIPWAVDRTEHDVLYLTFSLYEVTALCHHEKI